MFMWIFSGTLVAPPTHAVVDVAVDAELVKRSVAMVVLLRLDAPELCSSLQVVTSSGLFTLFNF